MSSFRFFWAAHKWTGVCLAAVFIITAVTGLLLLFKKRADWIMPPTQSGAAAPVEKWVDIAGTWKALEALDHEDFRSIDDIDRIDVRIDKRVYKVRSKHNNTEVQLAAATGEVLSVGRRRSDWIEDLHDGSLLGEGIHGFVMPVAALGLLFLVGSGLWLWIRPFLTRRQRRRKHAAFLRAKSAADG